MPVIDDRHHFDPPPEPHMVLSTVGLAAVGLICGLVGLWGGPPAALGLAANLSAIAALVSLAAIWRYRRRRGGMRRYARLTVLFASIALVLGVWVLLSRAPSVP